MLPERRVEGDVFAVPRVTISGRNDLMANTIY